MVDIDAEGLEQTATGVRERGRKASAHRVDVSDRAAMQALPAAVLEEHGRVDILVNNAGVTVTATFEEHSMEDLDWILGINLWGVIYGCKFFLPELRRSDEAYIVNLSSMFGLIGVPRQASYCTSKFAVRGLSEALAAELASSSIGVMSVHPGGIRTNIARSGRWRTNGGPDRDAVVRFFDEKTMPAEKAAELIVRGIQSKRKRLVITPEAKLTDLLVRALPGMPGALVHRLQERLFGASR